MTHTQESTPPTSQSDEALVEELARTMSQQMFGYDCLPNDMGLPYGEESRIGTLMRCARAILPIIERIRREGIEEAAKAYEAEASTWKQVPQIGAVIRRGAKVIRALAETQP